MHKNIKADLLLLKAKAKAKNVSVLYVEDEEPLRNKTADMLNKLFQNLETAVDGKDGLKKYLQKKYDIVITDISMPNMNGLELISNIRKNNLHQEIIIMSAHTESEYTDQINTIDIADYIYKPVDINQMMEVLNSSIERLTKYK